MRSRLRVDVDVRPGVRALLPLAEARRVLVRALEAAGAPGDARVTLALADDAELARLNFEHMGKEGPTDVLSFPLLPVTAFPVHPGQDPDLREGFATDVFRLPPGEPVDLGDIVVSVERAIEQAESGTGGQTNDVRWTTEQELRLLITHGALHLCGWDHAVPEEKAAMRALESRLLAEP